MQTSNAQNELNFFNTEHQDNPNMQNLTAPAEHNNQSALDQANTLISDLKGPALSEFAKKQFFDYAMSVVTGRAVPALSDGLKPVHRRILYAMYKIGLHKATKHVKSARVVGEVLGRYHPHGDSSVYDAMVRMAQPWSLRYPLVDGQGNFGSLDGDNAAAMRYTESKLRPIADLLLSEIDDDTVDFVPNYDGVDIEPSMLPARLPFILLNGSSGIAVGMATEIPSHNLREIAVACCALVKNPDMTDDDILANIPGPDFPGGGQIISSKSEIKTAMLGRGALRVRARWAIETLARGQWQIAISELPPGVSIAQIMSEIEERSNPKPKPKTDKKTLSPAELSLKASFVNAIDAVRDESDKNHGTRLVIEPKSSRDSPEDLMQLLLAYTSLEINVSSNMTVLRLDKSPKTIGVPAILREWCQYRFQTVTRRTNHKLLVAEKRIHILEGRMAIILDIDKAIKIIRTAENPKEELIAVFGLTEIQADDVLDIRLRQLARLESIKISEELLTLKQLASYLRNLLESNHLMRSLISTEIEEDAKIYGDDRRTLIESAEKVTAQDAKSVAVANEPVTLIISKQGWLRARQGHSDIDPAQMNFRSSDSLFKIIQCRTIDNLTIMDQKGRVYTIDASTIPGGKGDGVPLTALVDLYDGGKLLFAEVFGSDESIMVATTGGYGFRCKGTDLFSRNRAGKAFLTVPDGEKPITFSKAPNENEEIACVTKDDRCLVFKIDELKFLPKGRGLKLIDADPGQTEMVSIESSFSHFDPIRVELCRSTRGGKGKSLNAVISQSNKGASKNSQYSNEPVTIVLKKNNVALVIDGHGHEISKEDEPLILEGKRSNYLGILDQNGRVYSVLIGSLPVDENGHCEISDMVDFFENGKLVLAQVFDSNDSILVATSGGYGFQCKGEDIIGRNKAGKAFLTIQDNEVPVTFRQFHPDIGEIACLTRDGRGLVFNINEIKYLPKGRGLKLIEAMPGATELIKVSLNVGEYNPERVSVCRASRGGKGRQLVN